MLTVATVYYDPTCGIRVPPWAFVYSPEWVDRLYRGIARNYREPFRFVALTDRRYAFKEAVEILPMRPDTWDRVSLQGYAIPGADRIAFMGIDTVILGPLDDIFAYDGPLAVPRDPYRPTLACNGVVLCPQRFDLASAKRPLTDMTVLDTVPHDWLDDLFPGRIVSYKCRVVEHGLNGASIVYFHGTPKPDALHDPWVKAAWV